MYLYMKDKKNVLIITSGILIIILLFAVTFFLNKNRQNTNKNNTKYDVYTVPSQQNIFLDGEVKYSKKVNFTEDATKGTLENIDVEDKDKVKKGQTLFEYKNEQAVDQYETLKSQLSSTGTQQLHPAAQRSDIEQQLDSVKDKRYTSVSAPFDGIVMIDKNTENSDGKSILTLVDPKMQVVANASEKDILKLKKNQRVKISIYGTSQEITGSIKSISTQPTQNQMLQGDASAASNLQGTGTSISYYPVYIDIDGDQKVYEGFHVQATAVDETELPKIPSTAIFKKDGDKFVWLVENKKLKKVLVQVEKYNSTYVKIRSGLNFGDKIIKNPSGEMKEGDSIDTATSGS